MSDRNHILASPVRSPCRDQDSPCGVHWRNTGATMVAGSLVREMASPVQCNSPPQRATVGLYCSHLTGDSLQADVHGARHLWSTPQPHHCHMPHTTTLTRTSPPKHRNNNPSRRRTGSHGKGSPLPRLMGWVENTPSTRLKLVGAGLAANRLESFMGKNSWVITSRG